MKHDQFAALKVDYRSTLYVNTQYITSYGYSEGENKTVVTMLGERTPAYFPGDQTHKIYASFNSIED